MKKVFKTNLKLLCLWLPLFLILTGCVSSDARVMQARQALQVQNDGVAEKWAAALKKSIYSPTLGQIEAGRIKMLQGDFSSSVAEFETALESVIEHGDEGPQIKLGDVGANIMAGTITDDRTRPYRLAPYEFIQALEYQLLNHLFLGDLESAGVEARRAVFAQDAVAEKYGADLAPSGTVADTAHQEGLEAVAGHMQEMQAVADLARSSYENGLTWWLCGLVFSLQNDNANARLAWQKAHELAPGNPFVTRDWLRALRTEDPSAFQTALNLTGFPPEALRSGSTEVMVIYEEGWVPQRLSHKVSIPVMGSFISLDFPFYNTPGHTPIALALTTPQAPLGQAIPVLNVQALAYKDLKEKLPGVVTRNITRATTRLGASVAAREAMRSDHNAANIVGATLFLGTAIASAVNRADTRAWYTLPMCVHLWRESLDPGHKTLRLKNSINGQSLEIPLELAKGEKRLIWVADPGGKARVVSATLNGLGEATSFKIMNSLLH